MAKISYKKPPLTFENQIDRLKDRGLIIEDEQKAVHLLQNVSYYRLSGYWYPFLENKETHQFKANSKFADAFKLYCFDRELRLLLTSELEKIEVAVRSQMIYALSLAHGGFWFENESLFKDKSKHDRTLVKIKKEYLRSDEEFIKAFKKKYNDGFPPSWMTMEIVSFGTVSQLYSNLRQSTEKRRIANYFGLSDTVFEKWLHSLVYLRNLCAHHSRFWNRSLSIQPPKPLNPKNVWLVKNDVNNKRAYFALSMIIYLLKVVNPGTNFHLKFKRLTEKFENVDLIAMGFPSKWEEEKLWNA